jgi:2',3'-cyclic-nucleotide 2'-phosphodiesterase (5'-nucleotidase family)
METTMPRIAALIPKFFLVILIASLLGACGSVVPAATPTPSQVPTQTLTPSPTLFPTSTPRATLTALPSVPGQSVTITVLTTSDLHIRFDPYAPGWFPGLGRIAAFAREVREQRGAENVLLLDGGDTVVPLTRPEEYYAADDLLQAIGYDAIAIGNHEWDAAKQMLVDRVARTGPLFLAANMTRTGSAGECGWEPYFNGYRIFEKGPRDNPVRIAVIGITPKPWPDASICNRHKPVEVITYLYENTEVGDADAIIVVTHASAQMPLNGGRAIVSGLEEKGIHVALILGGHGHLDQNEMLGTSLLLEPGAETHSIGVVTLTINKDDGTTTVNLKGVEPLDETSPLDPETMELMEAKLRPLFPATPTAVN